MATYSYKEVHEVVDFNKTHIIANLNPKAEGFDSIKKQVKEFGFTWNAEESIWIYKGDQKEQAMSFLKGLVNKDNVWSPGAKQEEGVQYGITKGHCFLNNGSKIFSSGNTHFAICNNAEQAIRIYKNEFGFTAEEDIKAVLESNGLFRITYF